MWLLWHGLVVITSFVGCSISNPLGSWNPRANASMFGSQSERFVLRDDIEFDQTDLSFITSMAAIGDSYSAGIGAGDRLGDATQFLDPQSDFACSRYDHSYPYLINTDDRLGNPATRTFQFKSCSGAVIADVLKDQIPNISGNQQVILLSAGGNDVGLTNILNQCIFQWAVLNSAQVAVAKTAALLDPQYEWAQDFDWDSLGLGCEGQLAHTETLIGSSDFSKRLDSVIAAAKAKLGPTGMLYYTGYAKFWDEALSSACDSVTWTTWIYKLYNIFQPTQKLTTAHRSTMNNLVDAINAQISAAVDRAGSHVKFVNYDHYVGYFNGRFCAAGVDESTTESNTRADLMFYELNTWDPDGNTPWKRTTAGSLNGTFEGDLGKFAQITLLMDPNAQLNDQPLIVNTNTNAAAVTKVSGVKVLGIEIPNILPDGYGRVFHPQILLHQIIAGLVIYDMVNLNEQNNGFQAVPEKLAFESCPYYPPAPGSNSTNGTSGGQQIGLASYINPLGDPAAWNRLIGYPASKISILVANVMNGPDSTVDASWTDVITRGAASGKKVLGYVRTGYLGVSWQHFTTRLGSGDLADWTAQIEQDVNMWYKLYPNLGGIFFDEGWPECGANNQYADLYKYINDYTKRAYPGALTVLNPGSPMASCFEDTMDTLLTFELNYTSYINSYTANDWVPKDPRKLWHIIYNVPTSEVSNVAQLAAKRGAGFVQITDDVLPNPYDTLPIDSYMQSQMGAVAGGVPLNNDASAWASGGTTSGAVNSLTLVASDYSSASLSWTAATDALGYYVYLADTDLVASVPSSMTSITIGGLTPSTTYEFHVLPVGYSGRTGFSSNRVTVYTKPLPGGLTVTNYSSSPSAGSSTYHANILVPYAFVHLYIWDSIECDFDTNPGWPINFVIDDYVCTHYMVEDTTLYKYTGTVPSGSTAAPWAWTEIGPITRVITGYTYTWTLPLGTLTTDTSKFVVQVQGYNPYTTVFEPDPTHYDCKGSTLCTTPGLLAWCDDAVNNLGRNDSLSYATFNSSQTGNCWGDGTRSCGVFVQGPNCAVSGNDMWWDYQNIRKIGGCKKCGSYHRDDGCLITVNYVYKCDVGQGGPLFS